MTLKNVDTSWAPEPDAPTALIPTGVLPSISMKITTLFEMSAPSGVGATFTDADTPAVVLNDFLVTVKASPSCKSGT
ncbi:hypothetical protein D3C85_1423380 [compost metagenome]